MYKKVFILILVVCVCGISIFSYKTYKQEDKTISNKQIENIEIIEEQDLVDVPVVEEETQQEETVEEKKEETKIEPIIENKKETTKEEKVIKEDTPKDTNNSTKQPTEEKEIITNKEEDSKQDITNEEEIKEVEVEYENLLKQVEYSTYDECMDIGFEKALEDTINILGFSCPYIAYKGEIIGYRLVLNYTNPMEN